MAFNPLQNFNEGFNISQAQQAIQTKRQNNLDDKRKKAGFEDARVGLQLLESNDENGFLDFAGNRISAIEALGGDTSDTRKLLDLYNSGGAQVVMDALRGTVEIGITTTDSKGNAFLSDPLGRQLKQAQLDSLIDPAKNKNFSVQSSEIFSDGSILTVGKGGGRNVINAEGVELKGKDAKAHFAKIKKNEIAHKRELKKLEVDAALSKERAKGLVAREKEDISNGVSAAQSIPVLMRADKLLDMVGTGKPQEALLWGKKMLGIESGDSAELENLLGKAIVKQLKPIFGGSFSVGEGDWLKSMSADWGRSTEGNRRLVRQGLALANKRADIGYTASEGCWRYKNNGRYTRV